MALNAVLNPAPNRAVMRAIEQLNYRVTVGDVATQAGLDVKIAERDLVALAADAGAHLQVGEAGDLAYQFSSNFRAILRNKFLRLRLQESWQKIWQVLFYLIRISFGILLIISIVLLLIALVAIVIILTQSSKEGDNKGRKSSQNGGLSFLQGWQLMRLFYLCGNLFTNYSYRRPAHRSYQNSPDSPDREADQFFATQTQKTSKKSGKSGSSRSQDSSDSASDHDLNFLEAIFSFLFGDGDPNEDLEARRWQAIASLIRNQKGVVIAEQVAPYLDNLPQGWAREDEDYMLPVLSRFEGRPAVSPRGQLVYYFPELQVTAKTQGKRSDRSWPPYLQEEPWVFSEAKGGQIAGAIGLGVVNFSLAIVVGIGLLEGSIVDALAEMGLDFIVWLYPLLLFYGVGFLVIPSLRYFWLQGRNRKITARNEARKAMANLLQENARELTPKLTYAQEFAAETVVSQKNVLYSTESDWIDQEVDRLK